MNDFTWYRGEYVRPTWSGGSPAPEPDPFAKMKPITSIVATGDSILDKRIGYAVANSLTFAGSEGVLNSGAIWNAGALIDFKGQAQPEIKGRCLVTSEGAEGEDVSLKMLGGSYNGSVTGIDSFGVKVQYGLTYAWSFIGYAAALSGKFPELLHWAAMGGLKTGQMLARIPVEVIPYAPSHVIISCGTNDIANSGGLTNEEIIQNLQDACGLCTAAGIQVLLYAVTPSSEGSGPTHAERRKAINAALKEWCETQADVFLLDVWPYMADPETGYALPGMLSDTVHPTAYGYRAGVVPLLEIFNKKAVHYIPDTAVNRLSNPDFAKTVAASSGFTGIMPDGFSLVKSNNATYTAVSSVANGEWTVEISGGREGETCTFYLMPNETASIQAQDSRNTTYLETRLEADSEVAAVLHGSYVLNGTVPVIYGMQYANWLLVPGGEWYVVTGRDLPVAAGDNFGAGRPNFRLTVPAGGNLRATIRKPGVLRW